MGIMLDFFLWVMQDLYHQPYLMILEINYTLSQTDILITIKALDINLGNRLAKSRRLQEGT